MGCHRGAHGYFKGDTCPAMEYSSLRKRSAETAERAIAEPESGSAPLPENELLQALESAGHVGATVANAEVIAVVLEA